MAFETPWKTRNRQLSEVEAEATPFGPPRSIDSSSRKDDNDDKTPRRMLKTPSSSRRKPRRSRIPTSPLSSSQSFPKTVFLIRHGESLGQVAAHDSRMNRRTDPRLRDAGLTETGIQQALAIPALLGGDDVFDSIQLVVSSPLTRALHTAALAFRNRCGCPLLVHYDLREVGSLIPENTPRSMQQVLQHLQQHNVPRLSEVDVRSLQPPQWPRDEYYYASSKARIQRIQQACLQWLAHERRECVIAVVCHFHVIRGMLCNEEEEVVPRNAMPIPCHLFADGTLRRIKQASE